MRLTTSFRKPNEEALLGNALLQPNNIFIIGSEAIYKKETPNTQGTGDSMFLYYNLIFNALSIQQESRPTTEHDWQQFLREHGISSDFCLNIIKDQDFSPYIDCVSEELMHFLRNGIRYNILNTIFTTAIDDMLEYQLILLCEEYGKELEVYNLKAPGQLQEYANRRTDDKVALVYLFGKLGDAEGPENNPRVFPVVFTEDDAMITIADYFKESGDNKKKLYERIFFDHHIMAIGCRFDDWKFRFFWLAIHGDIRKLSDGTVAYSCSNPEMDSLYRYLHKINGLYLSSDSRQFMGKLAEVIEGESLMEEVKRHRQKGEIFISYASEDIKQAIYLFQILYEKYHFKVWLDQHKLQAADAYSREIDIAIKQCDVFIPILSSQTRIDLSSNPVNERYYMKEWSLAYNNARFILPIMAGDYATNSSYHAVFRERCGFESERDITIKSLHDIDEYAKVIRKYLDENQNSHGNN